MKPPIDYIDSTHKNSYEAASAALLIMQARLSRTTQLRDMFDDIYTCKNVCMDKARIAEIMEKPPAEFRMVEIEYQVPGAVSEYLISDTDS